MLHHKPLLSDMPCRFIRRVKTVQGMCADHVRSHLCIPGKVRLGRRQHARAWLEHVLDGGSLWGGLRPGSHCFDSNMQTAENTVSLTCHTLPSCSTSSASIFIWCPTEAFSLTIYFWVTIKFSIFFHKKIWIMFIIHYSNKKTCLKM